jgi:predicted protein tyrosine phosphatase
MKILCICNQGENRSRTTADIINLAGLHTARYDGFHKETLNAATGKWERFKRANLDWADRIIIFQDEHEQLLKGYGQRYWGKSLNFDIPDRFFCQQPELVALLQERFREFDLA